MQEAELSEEGTCKEYLQVRQEGSRQVRRALKHYNLSMILEEAGDQTGPRDQAQVKMPASPQSGVATGMLTSGVWGASLSS